MMMMMMMMMILTIFGEVIFGCNFLALSLNVLTAIRLLSVPPEVKNPTVSLLPFNMAAVILTISVSIFLKRSQEKYWRCKEQKVQRKNVINSKK